MRAQFQFFLFLSFVFILFGLAINQDVQAQSDQAGFTVGYSSHTSYWFRRAETGDPQVFPINKTTKIIVGGFYEISGLFDIKPFNTDLRFEAFLGFGGETKEDWLPLGETVSNGDIGYGLAAILKFGYPVKLSSGKELIPFLGIGPGLAGVSASGEASEDTEYADEFDYSDGFADGVYGLLLDLGVSVPLEKVVVTPQIRFLVIGDSFGDWDFVTSSDGAADWFMFSVSIGFSL